MLQRRKERKPADEGEFKRKFISVFLFVRVEMYFLVVVCLVGPRALESRITHKTIITAIIEILSLPTLHYFVCY